MALWGLIVAGSLAIGFLLVEDDDQDSPANRMSGTGHAAPRVNAHSASCHLTDGAQHPTCLNPSRQLPNLRHTSSGSNQPETISRAPSKKKTGEIMLARCHMRRNHQSDA